MPRDDLIFGIFTSYDECRQFLSNLEAISDVQRHVFVELAAMLAAPACAESVVWLSIPLDVSAFQMLGCPPALEGVENGEG